MELENLEIKHDEENQMFYARLLHSPAQINYTMTKKGVMNLNRTYVPVEYREKGLGSALIQHVLEYARKKGIKVIPTCPFVEEYIRDHPEHNDLVYQSTNN